MSSIDSSRLAHVEEKTYSCSYYHTFYDLFYLIESPFFAGLQIDQSESLTANLRWKQSSKYLISNQLLPKLDVQFSN